MGRKREAEGYVNNIEERMKNVFFLMDYVRIRKIYGEQVKQDQRFMILLTVS